MATHNLPYPLSDNRSYIAVPSSRTQQDALYGHDDLQHRPAAAYKHPEYHRFYASPVRTGATPAHNVLEDIHERQSEYDPRLQAGGAYAGSSSELWTCFDLRFDVLSPLFIGLLAQQSPCSSPASSSFPFCVVPITTHYS